MSRNGRTPSSRTASGGRRPAAAGNPRSGPPLGGGRASGHARVAEVQRARLVSAMVAEVAERGAASVSVAHVVARAGVSRRTFYELFADRDDCFLAAFEDALARAGRCVQEVDDPNVRWAERIRTALVATLGFLDGERDTGQLLIVGSLAAGPVVLERRQRVLAQIAALIDRGRAETKTRADPPPLTAEGVVGGVLSILQTRLTSTPASQTARTPGRGGIKAESLLELTSPLMGTIVLPYLGPAAARRETERPVPKPTTIHAASPRDRDPLQGLDMRLTYRTIRVLTSIAEEPGSSNRHIGETAEINDQGQVSKLLARLQRLGLIENHGEGAATRGEPNAWQLTTTGTQIHDTIANLEK